MKFSGTAKADTRFSFTPGFIVGATMMARRAAALEKEHQDAVSEEGRFEHRACVAAAIMQATAALESEAAEVVTHGPGHQLGSNGVDAAARDFLSPLAGVIDGERVLERYAVVLHLLRRTPLDRGAKPWQRAALLVRLRNEIVHYKSRWGEEMSGEKLWESLRLLRLPEPLFNRGKNMNFFPHLCLSAATAAWAGGAATDFIDAFYASLGVANPLDAHRARFNV